MQPRSRLERRSQELGQQGDADKHREERNIYEGAVHRKVVQLVQFKVDVGVQHYAAESLVGIQGDEHHRDARDQRERNTHQPRAHPHPLDAEQLAAYQVEAQRDRQYGHVDDEDGSQRIKDLSVGIQRRRKQVGTVPGTHSPYVEEGRGSEDGNERRQEASLRTARGQEHEHRRHEQRQGEPHQVGIRHRSAPERLLEQLEERPAVQADRGASAGRQRLHGEAVIQMQDRIGVIGTASVHRIRHFQAPYDLAFVARDHLDKIPALAYVQEGGLVREVGERRSEVVVGVGQALEKHARTDVVVQDYEGMVPGLQDIVHIAVDDHV